MSTTLHDQVRLPTSALRCPYSSLSRSPSPCSNPSRVAERSPFWANLGRYAGSFKTNGIDEHLRPFDTPPSNMEVSGIPSSRSALFSEPEAPLPRLMGRVRTEALERHQEDRPHFWKSKSIGSTEPLSRSIKQASRTACNEPHDILADKSRETTFRGRRSIRKVVSFELNERKVSALSPRSQLLQEAKITERSFKPYSEDGSCSNRSQSVTIVKRSRSRTVFCCQQRTAPLSESKKVHQVFDLVKAAELLSPDCSTQSTSPSESRLPKHWDSQESLNSEEDCNTSQFEVQEWRRGAMIGQGAYGQVFKALEMHTGTIFAVKQAQVATDDESDRRFIEKLSAELLILRELRHPNIVSYFGYEMKDSSLSVFMEYVPGGSLASLIKEFGAFKDDILMKLVHGVLQGLNYLHTQITPVIHRDIKCANILVDLNLKVKLTDFGCSKRSDLTTTFTTIGSIPWMAPEVIMQQDGYGRKADVWSFGCTIIEMATAELPWGANAFDNPMFALRKIAMSDDLPDLPKNASTEIRSLVSSCLVRNVEQRPDASTLLSHRSFTFCRDT